MDPYNQNTTPTSRSRKRGPTDPRLTSENQPNPFFSNPSPPQFYYNQPNPFFQQPFYPNQQSQPSQPFLPTQYDYNDFRINTDYRDEESASSDEVPKTQPDPEPEPESEEEPEPVRRKGKKVATEKSGRRKQTKRWTQEEEVALAQSFCAVSSDPIHGNNQISGAFYTKMLDHFHGLMKKGPYRRYDMLRPKWKETNRKCTLFGGIYNRLAGDRRSGQSDDDILSDAFTQYAVHNRGTAFTLKHVWDVLRRNPKWSQIPPIEYTVSGNSSKRSRTSGSQNQNSGSDAHVNIDIDLNDEEFPLEPERPIGRNRAKARNKAPAQSPQLVNLVTETFGGFKSEFSQFVQTQSGMFKMQEIEYLYKPHDHLTGDALEGTLQIKREIARKHGLPFNQ